MDTVNNQDLQLAFDFVRYTNRNIFLTGKAGTGKTTFLRELKILSPKRQVIVAPTGVAAINAGGVTIHSFFQLPFHPYIPSFYLPGYSTAGKTDQDDPAGYKMSREKINIIKSLDLLIIDEISMVRADTLDAIDSALRRYKDRHHPFGGVQLLMIGDLHQLAPVVKDEDREILSKYYDSFFFFGSRALARADYVTIELKHVYRQTDQTFIRLLNKVRDNNLDTEVLDDLNKRYIPDFDPDTGGGYIILTTHNNQARAINESKLDKLPGRPRSFRAVVKDEFPELSYPNDAELILKKGAQVMFVKNDLSPEKLFFNGKIGMVEDFEEDCIVVKCPEDELPIYVEKAEWQNVRYTLDEDTKELDETVIGTFIQYPLRLAWAITIHKSQGLTFDRAVIDAKAAFAHGQVYVALSRCRTLEGIVLSSLINNRSLIDNPAISDFLTGTVQKQPGPAQLEQAKKAYREQLLSELFDFNVLAARINYCKKIVDEHSGSLLGNPREMLEKAAAGIRTEITEVSGKFREQIRKLSAVEAGTESFAILQERVQKASLFFSEKLGCLLKDIIEGYTVETDSKIVRKSVNEAFERARKDVIIKLACLDAVKSGFRISEYLDARAKAAIDIPAVKKSSLKPAKDVAAIIKNPILFSRLKEWRNHKAKESGVPHYRILHQKAIVALSDELPQTLSSLNRIKGIGKKKAEKFGSELLEIIGAYCKNENIEIPEAQASVEEIPEKKKIDTKKISLDLWREGRSVSQIADERELSTGTIEAHLAHYVSTGEISLQGLVSQELTDLISSHLDGSEDLRMGPVKEALGEKVSWSDIRFVVSHLKYLRGK
ncbi:MAG: helix-turn-helix domain-containing protein [Bacteroidales bacterium]|nr:helix-turn-helix domain-containing protein [Bacteroidales bacterium]